MFCGRCGRFWDADTGTKYTFLLEFSTRRAFSLLPPTKRDVRRASPKLANVERRVLLTHVGDESTIKYSIF